MAKKLTYTDAGVDYGPMDAFKRAAQSAARETEEAILPHGYRVLPWSRGESCLLYETPFGSYDAHVEEGLGTKGLVADAMRGKLEIADVALRDQKDPVRWHYRNIAQDAAAMILNDMAVVGAQPISLAMHLAVGDSRWFEDERRVRGIIEGWKAACERVKCAWGPGETSTVVDVVLKDTFLLSGSAKGVVNPRARVIEPRIEDGDAIILVRSSGINANGLSLARRVADELSNGYATKLPNGRSYGETLLNPTVLYGPLVELLLDRGVPVHYAVHITGHGWCKLMRAEEPFTYIIEHIPEPPHIFSFIQEQSGLSDKKMYGIFSMGAGFAFIVPARVKEAVMRIARECSFLTLDAGRVEKSTRRHIHVVPKGFYLDEKDFNLRL